MIDKDIHNIWHTYWQLRGRIRFFSAFGFVKHSVWMRIGAAFL
jgi:hypothetical protein